MLASTVLVPYWLFIGFCLCIFPGPIGFIFGPLVSVYYQLAMWSNDSNHPRRDEFKRGRLDGLCVTIAPLLGMYASLMYYLEKGEFDL
jgi:hypothetical protein